MTDTPYTPTSSLLAAWLAQSHDLLALCDAQGRLRWCNAAFERTTGLAAGAAMPAVLDSARDAELELRGAGGQSLWVMAHVTRVDDDWLWTLQDVTERRQLAARAQHLSELLDMAQEFGRLGVWEREIPSGTGRWDRHVFAFWGLDPANGTPRHADAAARIHPDDQNRVYAESTRRAGRYSQRYRVVRSDGSWRWIHSQWEVKNSPEGVPDRAIGIMLDDTQVYELARSRDAAEGRLKLVTELADIVVWRHDLATGRMSYNDHGFKVLGIPYRPDGLTLEEVRAHTHPDDVAKLAATATHALETGAPVDVEIRHRRDDGQWRTILVRRVIERNPAGEPLGFIGVSLDVTAQVEQSRRAEQLTHRLEAAAGAARVGIWTTVIGTQETEWNAQMYELFDMVGEPQPPTLGEWIRHCVHPDDVDRVASATRAYLRGQTTEYELEFRIRVRNGQTRWMVLRADRHRSAEQSRIFGIAMDVTERHAAQAALHTANERAALIARHAGIGTWETDEHGGTALWDAQMFRLRGLDPRATSLDRDERLAMVHPDDLPHVLDSTPELHATPLTTGYEFRVRWPDGQYRWLASRSAPLFDASGRMVRRVGVNWDVTDHKNAEMARQQALLAERESRAKSRFLARMSHELRTPLNAVLGFTQLLQIEARQRPDVDRLAKLEHIQGAGEHLLELINDALDLSSLEAGTLKLDPQPVALAQAVGRALPRVEKAAAARRVAIRTGRLDGIALADSTRLLQVLLNLLGNAIRHGRAGGEVSLDSTVEPERTLLHVRDPGRAMTGEQLDRLFEPFNRLGPQNEATDGSGIGLTIARALVEGMGGRIDVHSEAGLGTVFTVTLPRADAQRAAPVHAHAPRDSALAELAADMRSAQVLYIEDNSVNVLLVESLMARLPGVRIVSDSTGAAGVARARALLPDLILVDMQLPDFDGIEVIRRLRADETTAAIPCIALSANAMPEDIARARAAGFEDYWTKPIRFREFLAAMARRFPSQPARTD